MQAVPGSQPYSLFSIYLFAWLGRIDHRALCECVQELVEKKMELAELHEELLKMSHAHAHAQQDNPKK